MGATSTSLLCVLRCGGLAWNDHDRDGMALISPRIRRAPRGGEI